MLSWLLLLAPATTTSLGIEDAPTLAEARRLAAEALGLPAEPAGGQVLRTGTSRLFGRGVDWSVRVDAEGRFLTRLEGPLSQRIGFDGEVVWMQHVGGSVRELTLGERSDELLAAWILSGSWTRDACPIQLEDPVLDDENPEDGPIHLRFRFDDAERGSPEPIRGVIRLDRDEFLVTEALWKRAGEVRGLGLRTPPADEDAELVYSVRVGERRDPVVASRHLQPVEPAPAFHARPDPTGEVRFDDALPAGLEVARTATGHLLVRAAVDGEGVWLFFDSGAGISMLDRGLAEALAPEVLGTIGVAGVGGEVSSEVARFDVLQLGPMSVEDPIFVTLDLGGLSAMLGHEVVGLLGHDVFARCVAAFSVADGAIEVFDPERFEAPTGTRWEEVLLFERHPAVRARVEGHEALLRIDTGSGDVLDLEAPAIERWNLLEGRATTASRSAGIGGEIETLSGQLESLELGGHRFEDVTVGFVQTTSGFHGSGVLDGNLGLGALAPFRVFFDYRRARVGFLPVE